MFLLEILFYFIFLQISYDLFQAQHRQEIHTHYLVFHGGFPFILLRQWFPQVSS